MWGALIAAGITEGYRFYQGQKQKEEARKFAKTPRPLSNMPIPPSVLENQRLAKSSYGTSGLPGQSNIENKLDASVQSGARNLIETGHGADTAAGIAALENSKMGAIADIGEAGAKLKLSKLATLMGANSELGGYENQKYMQDWNWNQRDPYLQDMAAASALKNAGEANTFNAISNIGTLAGSAMAMGGNKGGADGNSTANSVDYTPPVNPNAANSIPGVNAQFDASDTNYGINQNNDAVREQFYVNLQNRYPEKSAEEINQMLTALGL